MKSQKDILLMIKDIILNNQLTDIQKLILIYDVISSEKKEDKIINLTQGLGIPKIILKDIFNDLDFFKSQLKFNTEPTQILRKFIAIFNDYYKQIFNTTENFYFTKKEIGCLQNIIKILKGDTETFEKILQYIKSSNNQFLIQNLSPSIILSKINFLKIFALKNNKNQNLKEEDYGY